MKLHLPLSLRFALALSLAALAAAPSHAAVTPWDLSTWTDAYNADTDTATVSSSSPVFEATSDQSWDSTWAYVMSVDASDLAGDLTLMAIDRYDGTNHHYSEGATLTAEADGSLKLHLTTYSADVATTESVSFAGMQNITFVLARDNDNRTNGNLSLVAYDTGNFVRSPLYTVRSSKGQTFGSNYVGGVSFGGLKTPLSDGATLSSDGATDFPTGSGSIDISKAGYSLGSMVSVTDLVNYYYGENRQTLTWNGGESGNWSDASWSDGASDNQTFGGYDSVTFATEGATVTLTGQTPVDALSVEANTTIALGGNNLNAFSLEVADGKTLSLSGGGTVDILALAGGAVNVDGPGLTVSVDSISGSSVAVADGATLSLVGTTLTDTTVEGKLTLSGNDRVTVEGAVSIGSVANNLTASDGGYAFVGDEYATLTFTGTTNLTVNGNGEATTHSKIGLTRGTLIVAEGASLTTSRIYNSRSIEDNAHVRVDENATLALTDTAAGSSMASLENSGTITTAHSVSVHGNIVNNGTMSTLNNKDIVANASLVNAAEAELSAYNLRIKNTGGVESNLDGTTNVAWMLQLDFGSVVICGDVTAGAVGNVAGVGVTGVYKGTDEGSGTMTIRGDIGNSTSSATLSGNFAIVKQGGSTQTFNGNGATGDDARDGNECFTGSLTVEGGTLNVTNINLARLAQDASAMDLQTIRLSNGAALGLYSGATARGAVVTVSASRLETGAGGGTLNANVTLDNASFLALDSTLALGGALTLDGTLLSGALYDSLYQGVTSITLFTGVTSLTIGSGSAILPGSFTETNDDGVLFYQFSADELGDAFRNGFDADVYNVYYTAANGGSVIMTANVPEPATATLSLLALAGLCARRRRK